MSEKHTVQVLIGGKVTRLSGYESEEYLEKVASYLNHKIRDFDQISGYKRLPQDTKSVLLALNVADDYFKAKEKVESAEQEIARKDREMAALRQELISLQVMRDNMKHDAERAAGRQHHSKK